MEDETVMTEFTDVLWQWSKEVGKILNKEEIGLFAAGYFSALKRVSEEMKKAESENEN